MTSELLAASGALVQLLYLRHTIAYEARAQSARWAACVMRVCCPGARAHAAAAPSPAQPVGSEPLAPPTRARGLTGLDQAVRAQLSPPPCQGASTTKRAAPARTRPRPPPSKWKSAPTSAATPRPVRSLSAKVHLHTSSSTPNAARAHAPSPAPPQAASSQRRPPPPAWMAGRCCRRSHPCCARSAEPRAGSIPLTDEHALLVGQRNLLLRQRTCVTSTFYQVTVSSTATYRAGFRW